MGIQDLLGEGERSLGAQDTPGFVQVLEDLMVRW